MTLQVLAAGNRGQLRCRYRTEDGTNARVSRTRETIDEPTGGWLRLERRGDTFTGEGSVDGNNWTLLHRETLPALSQALDVGIASGRQFPVTLLPSEFRALQVRVSELEIGPPPRPHFIRGDCNADGRVDVSDPITTLGALFLGEGDPSCDDACDSNDDGDVDISDVTRTLRVFFLGQESIPLPGIRNCGSDPTDDQIGCDNFKRCS